MHTYRNLKHRFILNIMMPTLQGPIMFLYVLLGSRCTLTSNKLTLLHNHTMVVLYFLHVIINQFSAHLSFPFTTAYPYTRNVLKFVHIKKPPTFLLLSVRAAASFEYLRKTCTNLRPSPSDPCENTRIEIIF